ncbi:MAG: site-specific integrase [Sediminimonas qiaohouensis]|uniref:Site-specific integrase n=1 Tax=Sediminimonas qiaohouensis TaxID=552061 RepID=A0A7C9HCD3_9RHOB|nr:site-specific integrase [Sediminimonas qiaohouensis]MTJ04767.1 site-specific integrase [Sediminimonas qiaohouensis]
MKQAQTLSDKDVKRVLAYCGTRRHSMRDRSIIQTSILAGLRAKELAALCVGDVYDDKGQVRDQFIISGDQTKGGCARRVYVSRKLRRVLSEYQSVIRTRCEHEPLFRTQMNTAFSANTMCQLFLNIYKQCGLSDASSHSGRRTFITRLAEQGVNVRVLAELAGHRHISTTQRYIDVNDQQMSRAVELV